MVIWDHYLLGLDTIIRLPSLSERLEELILEDRGEIINKRHYLKIKYTRRIKR